jgi:hypothetical protein
MYVAVYLVFAMAVDAIVFGQEVQVPGTGFPEDWSQKHLIFSDPGTFREAQERGEFGRWTKIVNDPRFLYQHMQRNIAPITGPSLTTNDANLASGSEASAADKGGRLHRDWNVSLGAGGTVGGGNYPAKFSFNGAASCTDFAVFNTSLAGATGQATIIAFTNLYAGCTTTPPSVAWAYDTTAGDQIVTSVVLSPSGNQIAFISTNSSHAYLNVLYFQRNQGTAYNSPVSPQNTTSTGSTYSSCKTTTPTQSCLFRVEFANAANDTVSSPYYDYSGSDTLWVGDATGKVHKFTGVFGGSPTEAGSSWPASTASTVLTSALYDGTHVFVGGANGIFYSVLASTGAVTASGKIAGGLGITDAPLLDASVGELYVLVGDDNTGNCFFSYCSGVFQLPTTFGSGATGNEVPFGASIEAGTSTIPLYVGTFDNIYYTQGASKGNLFVCTISGGNDYLVQVPTANFGNGNSYGSYITVTSGAVPCSGVNEILSGGIDWLFLSVAKDPSFASGTSSTCSGKGCVYNFNVGNGTTLTFSSSSSPTAGFAVTSPSGTSTSGTSGIIVDNSTTSGTPTGAKIYFTPTANGAPCATGEGCAVQVSQSALQ